MKKINELVQIRFSKEELEVLEKLKKDLAFTTSAGLIRYLVNIAVKEIEKRG